MDIGDGILILADIYDQNGDMNNDGGLNIQDITLLLNEILN